ncbi:hypothetical protein FHT76_008339 [Rhizobium sp. BK176]|nr:hypothetical protein [Rhizobium sp. BK176]
MRQRPCGAKPRNLLPLGPHPRNGAMLVRIHVSSIKTTRFGSMRSCQALQRAEADGPEQIFGEWWQRCSEYEAVRDYFVVEDDAGERLWIFRSGDGVDAETGSHRWFMHGIFA